MLYWIFKVSEVKGELRCTVNEQLISWHWNNMSCKSFSTVRSLCLKILQFWFIRSTSLQLRKTDICRFRRSTKFRFLVWRPSPGYKSGECCAIYSSM